MVLDRLSIIDQRIWAKTAFNILRLLHKYKGRDMAAFIDLFDKDILNDEGEPYSLRKCEDSFFERIVGILPI